MVAVAGGVRDGWRQRLEAQAMVGTARMMARGASYEGAGRREGNCTAVAQELRKQLEISHYLGDDCCKIILFAPQQSFGISCHQNKATNGYSFCFPGQKRI